MLKSKLKFLKMPCISLTPVFNPVYLNQSNQSVSNFDISGNRDPNAALAILLNSINETPNLNYERQCRNGIYQYQMGNTKLSLNKIDELCKASCKPGSFKFYHRDDRAGTFVKKGS